VFLLILLAIEGKANECPEDFLMLYNGQEEGDFVIFNK
jgi:hypothetical protein